MTQDFRQANRVSRFRRMQVLGCLLGFGLAWLPGLRSVSRAAPTPLQPMISTSKGVTVIIRQPTVWPYPSRDIFVYPDRVERVRVQFVAQGDDWGAVYLDGRLLFQPHNFNRRQEFMLRRGAYLLEVTGVVRSDLWARGYLDVGRDDANALVVVFSKTGGVRIVGDQNAWLPEVL